MKIGTDIIEIQRIQQAIEKSNDFKHRVFTESEIAYCESRRKSKFYSYAGIFTAKESFLKALGTGLRYGSWQNIEILRDQLGAPTVHISGPFLELMKANNLKNATVSISHCHDYAMSTVLIEES